MLTTHVDISYVSVPTAVSRRGAWDGFRIRARMGFSTLSLLILGCLGLATLLLQLPGGCAPRLGEFPSPLDHHLSRLLPQLVVQLGPLCHCPALVQ